MVPSEHAVEFFEVKFSRLYFTGTSNEIHDLLISQACKLNIGVFPLYQYCKAPIPYRLLHNEKIRVCYYIQLSHTSHFDLLMGRSVGWSLLHPPCAVVNVPMTNILKVLL